MGLSSTRYKCIRTTSTQPVAPSTLCCLDKSKASHNHRTTRRRRGQEPNNAAERHPTLVQLPPKAPQTSGEHVASATNAPGYVSPFSRAQGEHTAPSDRQQMQATASTRVGAPPQVKQLAEQHNAAQRAGIKVHIAGSSFKSGQSRSPSQSQQHSPPTSSCGAPYDSEVYCRWGQQGLAFHPQ